MDDNELIRRARDGEIIGGGRKQIEALIREVDSIRSFHEATSRTINGLSLFLTCASHPEQYDVLLGDRQVAYFRLRCQHFSVSVPNVRGHLLLSTTEQEGRDDFRPHERQYWLTLAVERVNWWISLSPDEQRERIDAVKNIERQALFAMIQP